MTDAEKKLVFIHIAKTAGSSLTQLLQDTIATDRLDIRIHRPLATLTPDPRNLTFSVIRDPLDRLVSAFFWLYENPLTLWDGRVDTHNLVRELGLDRYTDCRDFLEHFDTFYTDQIQPYAENLTTCDEQAGDSMTYCHFNLFVPQHLYLCDARGMMKTDHLLRWDHLQDDITGFLSQVAPDAPPATLPHLYASRRRPAKTYASPRALAIVREIYSDDLQLPGMSSDTSRASIQPIVQPDAAPAASWTFEPPLHLLIGPVDSPTEAASLTRAGSQYDTLTFGTCDYADVTVDKITSLDDILTALPPSWSPHILVLWHPEDTVLPLGLTAATFPVVMFSDGIHHDITAGLRAARVSDYVAAGATGARIFRTAGHPHVLELSESPLAAQLGSIVEYTMGQMATPRSRVPPWSTHLSGQPQGTTPSPNATARALGRLHTALQLGLPNPTLEVVAECLRVLTSDPVITIDAWQHYLVPPQLRVRFRQLIWENYGNENLVLFEFLRDYLCEIRARLLAAEGDQSGDI